MKRFFTFWALLIYWGLMTPVVALLGTFHGFVEAIGYWFDELRKALRDL